MQREVIMCYLNKTHPEFTKQIEALFGEGYYADDNCVVHPKSSKTVAVLYVPAPDTILVIHTRKKRKKYYDMIRVPGVRPNDTPYWVKGDPI
jgi:hypothetical protein